MNRLRKITDVFVAAHGQDDNVGDPALRRAMLDGLAPAARRHVLVGSASESYLRGLALRADDVIYTGRRAWQLAAFRTAVRGGAAYVSNAGEIQLNRRRLRINRVDRLLIALIKARGGTALTTGLGVRAPEGKPSLMLKSLARACEITTWRDPDSQRFAGAGDLSPDWAFALGSETASVSSDARPLLVISMRGDTAPPSQVWLASMKALSEELALEIVVVSQVERDRSRGDEIAAGVGAAVEPWADGDHLAAETNLRSIYRKARLVVSDRLHVLIFAATEGAVPVYIPIVESTKIPRTLASVGLEGFQARAEEPGTLASAVAPFASKQTEVLAKVDAARSELSRLSMAMNSALSRTNAS